MALQKRSSLSPFLRMAILELTETSLKKIIRKYYGPNPDCLQVKTRSISINTLMLLFLIISGGMGISVCILLLENLYGCFIKNIKLTKISKKSTTQKTTTEKYTQTTF